MDIGMKAWTAGGHAPHSKAIRRFSIMMLTQHDTPHNAPPPHWRLAPCAFLSKDNLGQLGQFLGVFVVLQEPRMAPKNCASWPRCLEGKRRRQPPVRRAHLRRVVLRGAS